MISIRFRILLLATIALFAVAITFFIEYNDLQKKLQHIEDALYTLNKVQSLSTLVHSLQKERGLSAGLIVGHDESLYALFLKQRKITDGQFGDLTTDYPIQNQIISQYFSARLAAVRKRMDLDLIKWAELRDFYTSSVQKILDLMLLEMIPFNYAKNISHDLQFITFLAISRENMGLMRATLNRGYQQGQLSKNELIFLSHQYSNFTANLRRFEVILEAPTNKIVNAGVLIELRDEAFHSVVSQILKALNTNGNALVGSSAILWREASQVIDTMYNVEKAILNHYEDDLLKDVASYNNNLYWYGAFVFIVLLILILMSWFIVLRIFTGLSILTGSLDSVEKTQNYELRIPNSSKDEFGQLSYSINSLLGYTDKLIKDLTQILTEQKHSEEKLRTSEERYVLAMNGTQDGLWDWNVLTNTILFSARWKSMLGYTENEIKDDFSEWQRLLHPDDKDIALSIAEGFLNNDTREHSSEFRMQHKNGHHINILARAFAVEDRAGNITRLVGTNVDITVRKKAQEQLEYNAYYDLLTKLPNRVLLSERLNQAMVQCQRHHNLLAVIFLDLDGFKAVNDRYGHDVGDELLVLISQRMKEALREVDTLSRFGGDEFVAVLAGLATVADCQPVLDRLLLAAFLPLKVSGFVLNVSASIGVTLYPQDDVDADMLIRHADQAMYGAKQAGKNCYRIFDMAQNEAVNNQRESLNDIRIALERKEFVLHYQPKVNMRTGEVIGVEALIRWQHPIQGLVPPLEFLPVIEGHFISLEIGEWVIGEALSQIKQWQNRGIDLPISVNISAYQLQQLDFVERLAATLLTHTDVPTGYLELEILETSALSNINQVSATMDDCIELGVRFALDDFGTGYSSLTYLRRLPADLIKIDQTFVRDMLEDVDDLAIIEGVLALAKSFKLEVIAEGVETVEHGTALLQLGCNLAQGYGIAKPMVAADIPVWINQWKPDDAWYIEDKLDVK
jgi:diguanylate cyclase (GGDEF)-like protein/PAS domain S-box-containing protein